jgi:hypothetical protein
MENRKIVELIEKDGYFYYDNKQIISSAYPFTNYGHMKAFGILEEDGGIYEVFSIIHQCCTGLVVHKRSDDTVLLTSMPIIPEKAEIVDGDVHFSGAACNGEGTVAYIWGKFDYKWINKIR